MTHLIEYRPGVFAREGEFAVDGDGNWWRYGGQMWGGWSAWSEEASKLSTPPELLSFPVASTTKPLTLACGWETNQ